MIWWVPGFLICLQVINRQSGAASPVSDLQQKRICVYRAETETFPLMLESLTDVHLTGNVSDLTSCAATIFLSSSAKDYCSALAFGTIPVVPLEHSSLDLSHLSHWLHEGIWFEGNLTQLDELVGRLREMLMTSEVSPYLEDKISLADMQRKILSFQLPAPNPISKRRFTIFIAILSRSEACDRRDLIRRTWLASFYESDIISIEHRFFISKLHPKPCHESDVIELGIPDQYFTLTMKVHRMIEYLVSADGPRFDILLKLDDDVFIRSRDLLAHIVNYASDYYVWGSITSFSVPIRDETDQIHHVSFTDYPSNDDFYPLYPRGFAYALSRPLLERILAARDGDQRDLRVPFEDVSIGLTLRRLLNSSLNVTLDDRSERHFARLVTCETGVDSGITSDTWIVHHVNSSHIACMYSHDQSGSNICNCV